MSVTENAPRVHVIRDTRYDEGVFGAWEAHLYEGKTLIVTEYFGTTRDDAIEKVRERYATYKANGARTEEWIDL